MQLKRKVKTSAAISVSAARGTYEALGAKKGKADGGSKAPSIPSTSHSVTAEELTGVAQKRGKGEALSSVMGLTL